MSELFNTKTRQVENIENEQDLQQAVLSGTHSFKKGDSVFVEDKVGRRGYIPAERARDAINQGYTLKTDVQRVAHEYVKENQGLKGAAKVAIGQFADEFLMGVPELALDLTQDPYDRAKREALKNEFTATNTISGLAGFGAGLVTGAPIFKGITAAGNVAKRAVESAIVAKGGGEVSKGVARRAAEKLAPAIAKGVTEGGLAATPYVVTEAALGDLEGAGESLAFGLGVGSLFGGGGVLAKKFSNFVGETRLAQQMKDAISDRIAQSRDLQNISNEFAVKSLGGNMGQRQRLMVLEEALDDAGNVVGTTVTKNLKELGDDLKRFGVIDFFGSKTQMLQRIDENLGNFARNVSEGFEALMQKAPEKAKINANKIIASVKEAIEASPQLKGSSFIPYKNSVMKRLENLRKVGEPVFDETGKVIDSVLNLADLNREKTLYQNLARSAYQGGKSDIGINQAEVLKEAPKAINKIIRSIAQDIDPKIASDIITNQKRLGNFLAAKRMAETGAAREASNNIFGLTSYIAAGAGAASGAQTYGNVGAVAGALSGGIGREFIRRFGDQSLALLLDNKRGIFLAESAMGTAAKRLDTIGSKLKNMSLGKVDQSLKPARGYQTLNRLFLNTKEPKTKQEKQQAYNDVSKKLGEWVSNPIGSSQKVADFTGIIANEGAPQVAAIMQQKMTGAVNYLYEVLPKNPNPTNPFAPKIEWMPSDTQMAAFSDKAEIVEDPFKVLDYLETGELNKNHMEALRAVYPRFSQVFTERLIKLAESDPVAIDYNKRIKLSMVIGANLDQSLKAIPYYQQSFAVNPQSGAAQDVAQPMQQQGFSGSINIAQEFQTDADKFLT